MPNIKQITLPNGTIYDVRDSRVDDLISQVTRWVGVTTTEIYDGSTTSVIVIDGEDHNAENGDIASYHNMEFIWNNTIEVPKWQEFGSTGSLKALAFKDSVAVSTQVPATLTTQFTGKSATLSVSGTPEGSISTPVISISSAGETGIVKEPSFTVADEMLTVSFRDKIFKTTDANYSSSTPTFTGEVMTATGSYTPEADSVTTSIATTMPVSGTVTYSPADP